MLGLMFSAWYDLSANCLAVGLFSFICLNGIPNESLIWVVGDALKFIPTSGYVQEILVSLSNLN